MTALPESIEYVGGELDLFTDAVNWRAYWQRNASPYMGRRVVEVGAGIGTITRDLCGPGIERWVALEPDRAMAARLDADKAEGRLPAVCEPRCATTASLAPEETFDTALYIDVIEHIEDDRAEVARVCRHLAPGGHLIVLVPAHQALYAPFDAAIGHFRRYSLTRLLDVRPPGMELRRARYLDAVGLLASTGNKALLRKAYPTRGQIRLWDSWMVKASRWLDPVLGYHIGKSALAVWQKSDG